ncbi:MAG: hypothetical protein EAZ91_19780 [Cytophagales bacterium]|nr:MAG: hypothetical protein EAZ91_19780 [Cytophagales bacterium]
MYYLKKGFYKWETGFLGAVYIKSILVKKIRASERGLDVHWRFVIPRNEESSSSTIKLITRTLDSSFLGMTKRQCIPYL